MARAEYNEAYVASINARRAAAIARGRFWVTEAELDALEAKAARLREIEVACAIRLRDLTGDDMLVDRWPTAAELDAMLRPGWDPAKDFRGRPALSSSPRIVTRRDPAGLAG